MKGGETVAIKKKKPMTKTQKKFRADIRAQMRERGLLPPPKKPLNRKKFIQDAKDDWAKQISVIKDYWLMNAISVMIASGGSKPSLEAIGAAKVLKIACEMIRFNDEKSQAGIHEYPLMEMYDRIEPIVHA